MSPGRQVPDKADAADATNATGAADDEVRDRLLALVRRDRETRARLVADGTLFDGYQAVMERVHLENARALDALLDATGWPPAARFGEAAVEAALLVALHSISAPDFQRRCRNLLEAAVAAGGVPASHLARLEDRIAFNERRPQRYGTIFDWDERGELSPWTLAEPAEVEDLRRAVGLPPLAGEIARLRRESRAEGNAPPASHAARQAEIAAWARKVGWIA